MERWKLKLITILLSQKVFDHVLCVVQFDNIDDLVGTDLPVKFLEIEQERERLVFSARKASNDMKAFNVSLDSSEQWGLQLQTLPIASYELHERCALYMALHMFVPSAWHFSMPS